MNKIRVVTPLTAIALGGLMCVAISTRVSSAQVQLGDQKTDLEAKVNRLEMQVNYLQSKVNRLEVQRLVIAQQHSIVPEGNNVPPGWQQFEFGGRPYYMVPATKGSITKGPTNLGFHSSK